jgi:hypothetical protein
LPNNLAELVFKSNDVVSILVALDLRNSGLINSTVSIKEIEAEMTEESLMGDKWLLTYEAIVQKWVSVPKSNPVLSNEYFSILEKQGVRFYKTTVEVILKPAKSVIEETNLENTVSNVSIEDSDLEFLAY